ncbi:type II toxin-antitoxin system VapC family toxin [Tundrisphaera lichenicola]|uniref:type II toxin-antitoxin system VapC family toxin n=1 Tax=Tundrisphaera lichenicola TaxID=2029860 RepID=UPI003EBFC370
MLIYTDSVIPIYYYDHIGPFQARASRRIALLLAAGDQMTVSNLVRMECRIGPLRSGDRARLAIFDGFFASPQVRFAPLTAAVFDRAAEIRARYGFKTPDSIHLAAAVESGCDRMLTRDSRLLRYPDLTVEILP